MSKSKYIILKERYYTDEKKTEPTWLEVKNHPIWKKITGKEIDRLTISMMATVIGYHYKLRKTGTFGLSIGGWLQNPHTGKRNEKQEKAIAIMVAIAVKEESIEILNEDANDIQNISHEYGNGGVYKLLEIINQESEKVIFDTLQSIMRKSI
jgi:hypothetical protein